MYHVVWDVDSGGMCDCVRTENVWEISLLYTQFLCEPKTVLKNKVY